MGKFKNLFIYKGTIINLLNQGKIKDLKDFVKSHDLMYDKNFISIIYERYNISVNQFFNLFDDDGKVIVNFEDYICYANVFELLCKIDSSIINSLPKGYYNFLKYMHSFIKKSDNHFDVGYNFYTGEHDEFVKDNMTESGYKKMYKAIKEYILKYQPYFNEQNTVSDEIKL